MSAISNALSGLTATGGTSSSNAASSSGSAPANGQTGSSDPLASESTFLTLLVSQLQNQDPLSPVDSNQFVSQLTSYSQLEQLIGIHADTTTLAGQTTASGSTATSGTSSDSGQTTTAP